MPYAKQPLRELRFKELQPLDPWAGVLLATKEGPICPQYDEIYGRLARPVGMSESCVLANVHVPLDVYDRRSKAICQKTGLPILVFIHGGGFQAGSGDSDLHGPEYLVSKGVIVITFNYRINVFGYLSLNSTSVPGNNGLWDAITLLKWVQRNARAFGGDPETVTLAGQSCGSVAAHLVSLSKAFVGLLKRVILMSGVGNGGFYTASPAYAQSVATMFLGYVGINPTDADKIHEQLIHTPLDKIMEANRIVQLKTGLVSFVPVVEPERPGVTRILDDYPANLVKRGRAKDLPMIVGVTSVECQFFKQRIEYLDMLGIIDDNSIAILPPNITYSVSESEALRLSKITIDKYFEGGATVDKFIKYCTNSFFTYPAFKLAEWTASVGTSAVYMYQFDFDSEFNAVKFGKTLTYPGGGARVEGQTFVLRVNSLMDPDEKSFPPRTRDDLMKYWMTTFFVNFMRCRSSKSASS
uniref:Juvenile hormone esterase related protein transcript variant 2 n=1 Tax=Sesamia nonagrioides TaxID=236805 RepID=E7E1H4_9NEOP|nr:juvenile hormone esterase related protein transcript variant 2 [Sesamia nonagrioides]